LLAERNPFLPSAEQNHVYELNRNHRLCDIPRPALSVHENRQMAGKGKKTAIILKASVERSKTFQESGLTEYVLAVHPPAGERVRLLKKFRPLMNPKLIL
jgi:hypothetical protein